MKPVLGSAEIEADAANVADDDTVGAADAAARNDDDPADAEDDASGNMRPKMTRLCGMSPSGTYMLVSPISYSSSSTSPAMTTPRPLPL